MNKLFLVAALAMLATPVLAEGRNGGSNTSRSNSEAVAIVDAQTSSGAASVINYPADTTNQTTYSGEIRSAPSLGGLALGGGHPCAYAPATAQLSIIGGGAGFGGMKVDSACMLLVEGAMGDARAIQAANYLMAARDPAACRAMEAAGMVQCGDAPAPRARPVASTKGTAATFGTCAYDAASNKLTVSKRGGATIQIAAADCKASLGM